MQGRSNADVHSDLVLDENIGTFPVGEEVGRGRPHPRIARQERYVILDRVVPDCRVAVHGAVQHVVGVPLQLLRRSVSERAAHLASVDVDAESHLEHLWKLVRANGRTVQPVRVEDLEVSAGVRLRREYVQPMLVRVPLQAIWVPLLILEPSQEPVQPPLLHLPARARSAGRPCPS